MTLIEYLPAVGCIDDLPRTQAGKPRRQALRETRS
jgi:acyl-coenzyme A synthetase/AMP-(fatty) acid ligase